MNRTKRDTVENLYKSCRMGGDCHPDVVNKVENKTLADILLQVFSSIIYLGNVGIGTGKGSTGATSVRPIPEIPPVRSVPDIVETPAIEEIPLAVRPTTTGKGQTRPFSVPIDRIGAGFRPRDPTGIKPIDVIDPSSPAIITLQESLPDSVITIGEPNLETGDSIITNLDVITDSTSIQSHPTVYQNVEENIAILSVTPSAQPPTEVVFSLNEPTVDPFLSVQSVAGHLDPNFSVFVDPNITGDDILFGEEILLEPINPRYQFEIDELPVSSTPEQRIQRAFNRARQFYRRHIQQVRTSNLNLLGDVSRAITFGFENPAFDPEVTVEFENDVTSLAAAPDTDFADIRRISRPYITETPEGTIRVSRLGERAGMRTRSGTILSQNVHFYYDVSPVTEGTAIELRPLAPIEESFVESGPQESVFINELENIPEDELMDTYNDNFSEAHLIFNETEIENNDSVYAPTLISDIGIRSLPVFTDIIVSEARINTNSPFSVPETPLSPFIPHVGVQIDSFDFYLHPSLRRKKRKKRKHYF